MSNCLRLSQSISQSCRTIPGVSKIFLANKADISTLVLNATKDTVSGITLTVTGTTQVFYGIKPPKESASLNETDPVNITNQTYICQPKLVFSLPTLSTSVWNLYYQLIAGGDTVAVVKFNNESYFIAGAFNGLSPSGNMTFGSESSSTGKIEAHIELEGREPYPIQRLSDDLSYPKIIR